VENADTATFRFGLHLVVRDETVILQTTRRVGNRFERMSGEKDGRIRIFGMFAPTYDQVRGLTSEGSAYFFGSSIR